MKKIFFSMILSATILIANAQTSNNSQRKKTTQSTNTNKKTQSIKNKNSSIEKTDTLNNRKIYLSKETGQKATPTGQQATGTNGSHANMPKNAAKKQE